MLRHLTIILFILPALNSIAGTFDERADSAYNAEQYTDAINLYSKAISADGTSSTLYYNLGNAYYRNGDIAKAIISYERALRLDPTNSDAKANLEFVNSKIVDKKGETGTFFSNLMDSMSGTAHSNTWAWIALVFFVITIAAAALYMFTSGIMLRKIGFFGGIVSLLITAITIVLSICAKNGAQNKDTAVVTSQSTILSTSPRTPKNRTEEAMLLHEGTKVQILDSVSAKTDTVTIVWYDVQVDNNHRAWIKSSDVEII